MSVIKLALPGLWNHFPITKELILFMEQCPEAVKSNTEINIKVQRRKKAYNLSP